MIKNKGAYVSVIIPTFNRAHTISEAIDSVLNQTYRKLEIIVVDDGSMDNTAEVVSKYGEKINYIYQGNAGPSVARNNGIKQAKGNLIGFLDSDDKWLEEKLEKQVRLFDENKSLGIVSCGYYNCDERMNIISSVSDKSLDTKQIRRIMPIRNIFPTPSVLVKRECFDRLGLFKEGYRFAEDWDMWLRIIRAYDCYYAREPLFMVRHLKDSLSKSNPAHMYYVWDRIIKEYCDSYAQKRKAKSVMYLDEFFYYRKNGSPSEALGYLHKSLMEWPFNSWKRYVSLLRCHCSANNTSRSNK